MAVAVPMSCDQKEASTTQGPEPTSRCCWLCAVDKAGNADADRSTLCLNTVPGDFLLGFVGGETPCRVSQ
jgi:hypothetical protein